ncbi:MAG TPA: hypothetical protein DCS36_06250 [Sphingobacterium sp.]|jgi:hypothetical protein|nr:hypothetical protein [Sphingobacterium sp.]HAT91988.1 hypothetical protein [Sphingobacterium sp.]HAU54930.1 hypothetical protein [Sphingobacterium sp.]HCX55060.1 hypothetical protein [Sphingobacterium sp.]
MEAQGLFRPMNSLHFAINQTIDSIDTLVKKTQINKTNTSFNIKGAVQRGIAPFIWNFYRIPIQVLFKYSILRGFVFTF